MAKTHLELNRTGDKMPLVGYGCWKVDPSDCEDVIYNAIKGGYRLFDGAAIYLNEVEVGKGINKAIKEGLVKREDLFIVSKLWNNHHHKDHVRPALEHTLKDLGLDYLDLYLIHFPVPLKYIDPNVNYPGGWENTETGELEFERSPLHQTWAEMEKLVDAKLTRNIGVSNCNVQTILDMLTYVRYKPAVLQVELHPYLQQQRLVKWVQKQGIQVTSYSSFGPQSYVELFEVKAEPLLNHSTVETIATKHGKTTGQILLKWSIQRDVAVIPKSTNPDRLKSNLDLFGWELSADDVQQINNLERNLRFNDTTSYGLDLPLFD
ncbi:unnamed protein product [Cunninghamella blakesleeana]